MHTPSLRPARKPLTRTIAALALTSGLLASTTVPAQAHEAAPAAASTSAGASGVLATAASLLGKPYVYGGTTPAGFDCSGFTGYVLAQHGVSLPRTATAQMQASPRISADEAAPGDLVFFVNGGSAYHMGIYAGDGMIYDAGRSGGTVKHRPIWAADVVYTRVLA